MLGSSMMVGSWQFLVLPLGIWFLGIARVDAGKDLPSSFEKCHRSDPQFDGCLRSAVNGAIKLLKDGLPEFGIMPLEPLAVDTITINQGGPSAPITLRQHFTGIQLSYLTNSTILKYRTDLKKLIIKAEAITPRIQFAGNYTMDGRILLLPITGKGKANITLHRLKSHHELIGELVERDGGEKFMYIRKYLVHFDPKLVTFDFENLFNGDAALGKTMNQVLNDNWEVVFQELRSAYEDTFGYIFRKISNQIFLKVPMNKIFPE
ncbi:protein takeout-like [Anopheles darlingi]|uniref:protein takeout-like n=1 Tax=Anopheles darlingi TaxID=43151 RepID=UPI0020FFFAC0|nr:protein takeout-like [Anopheles darlingi]